MGLILREGGGSNIEPVPAGAHVAVCVGYADLGTQIEKVFGDKEATRDVHKLMILWDLPNERILIDGEDKPRMISARYTHSLHERAKLRKVLDSWRGRKFTDKELGGFDLDQVLGVPCQLNVIHSSGSQGKVFASVDTVIPIPRGMPRPALERDPITYQVSDGAGGFVVPPDTLPHFMREIIGKSREAADAGWVCPPKPGKQAKPEAPQTPAPPPAGDDDTPF